MYLDRAHSVIVIANGIVQHLRSITNFESHGLDFLNSSTNEIETSMKKTDNFMMIENSLDMKEIFTANVNKEHEPKETEELLTQRGRSKWLILKYIKASKSFSLLSFWIFSTILVILLCAAFDYSLVTWTQTQEILVKNTVEFNNNTNIQTNFNNSKSFTSFPTTLGILVIVITATSISKNLALFQFMFNANKNIHNSMFATLIKAPLKFFETNPSGRIMNRFTEDVGVLDDRLTRFVSMGSEVFVEAFAYLLSVLIINQWHCISMVIIGFLVFKIYNLCAPALRGVMRLEANAKSPVLSFAITSAIGKETIRPHKAEKFVNKVFNSHQDEHTAAFFMHIACESAFATWLDLLTAILFIFVIYVTLIFKSNVISTGYISLVLVQISNLSTFVTTTVIVLFFRTYGYLVNIERMFEFTELEQEDYLSNSIIKLPKSWPTVGEIQFVDLHLKYSDADQPILKNLNIIIESQAKIGVVGRTGAGKSSLISALFRLAKIYGTILIDGIDSKRISLEDLRSKISIIPQEPILFNASLRSNLDPFNEFDDATLWTTVESVELKNVFTSLDQVIEAGGSNLSLGQRQLVYLARAIVRSNKILVLDEATANVDSETDALIQKTLRIKFNNYTVITIAHRLQTVMDSDKILVMDNGQVVEYDHPDALLKNQNGYFYKMVQQMNAISRPTKTSENSSSQ